MLVVLELLLGSRSSNLVLASLVGIAGRQVVWSLGSNLLVNSVPNGVNNVSVVKSLKDTIAADHEKVEVIFQFETANFWVANDDIWITSILLSLGLDVSEGT